MATDGHENIPINIDLLSIVCIICCPVDRLAFLAKNILHWSGYLKRSLERSNVSNIRRSFLVSAIMFKLQTKSHCRFFPRFSVIIRETRKQGKSKHALLDA